uniref:Uncharacterized protein n=1 Tax=uncultured Dehalococcoidia bacterium TaxID=498747 RepID=A0A871YCB2_9CHLR|nr:hypothetical protein HULAa30F3_00028 [uncultured Dehalococcoidia bacterium]
MTGPQILLLVLNVLGGAAVIGSYAQGIISHPGSLNTLWGNISGGVRSLYFVSMILSALSYFAFIYFILFRVNPADVKIGGSMGYETFFLIFASILLFSSLWMPFTYSYVDAPNAGTWVFIRVVLIVVGLSSCALVWALLSLADKTPALPYWLAVVGAGYFAFHTLILDGLFWPALYK